MEDMAAFKHSKALSQAAKANKQALKPASTLEDFCFQVYIEVELVQSRNQRGPKLHSGVLYGYQLNQILEFPLKIKDLTPNSQLSIQIFDMEQDDMTVPLASTILDLFDCHQRLRQGTLNLELHLGTYADASLNSSTPGLTDHPTTLSLNNLLAKMQKWCKVAQVNPSWLDR